MILRRLLHGFLIATLVFVGGFSHPGAAVALPIVATPPLAALPVIGGWFTGQRPTNLGITDGHLAPCPNSPNCVVSQNEPDPEHAIAPLAYDSDKATVMATLRQVVEDSPRSRVIKQTDDYLYAEFESKLMGFVDDVEFYLVPDDSVVHIRSASRLGESDLGVNRQRLEAIREQFS